MASKHGAPVACASSGHPAGIHAGDVIDMSRRYLMPSGCFKPWATRDAYQCGCRAGWAVCCHCSQFNLTWRDSIWAELGMAGSVKHRSGWQFVALHFPDSMSLTTDIGTKGVAQDLVECKYERLFTDDPTRGEFTHTRHCVWRESNRSLTTNLIGEAKIRFSADLYYRNYHKVEQLLHTTRSAHAHDYKVGAQGSCFACSCWHAITRSRPLRWRCVALATIRRAIHSGEHLHLDGAIHPCWSYHLIFVIRACQLCAQR